MWSIGEGEETEKRDDSERSTLFVEKPQSGTVSVGKCLEKKSKATHRGTGQIRDKAEPGKIYAVPVTFSFCPQLQVLPLVLVGCEFHSLKAKRFV